jgi:hypothetical protein
MRGRFVDCKEVITMVVQSRGGVQPKVRGAVYMLRRRPLASLSITRLTNAPLLRLLPDSVDDTASLPFYL